MNDLDRELKEKTVRHWTTIRQPFLSEDAEKNLRLLVAGVTGFDKSYQ